MFIFQWFSSAKALFKKPLKTADTTTIKPTKSPKKWWAKVKTDKARATLLILSILSTLFMACYGTFVYNRLPQDSLALYITSGLFSVFFVISEIIMTIIYYQKNRLEADSWQKLREGLKSFFRVDDSNGFVDILKKIQTIYRDSLWVGLTPQFALFLYVLIICVGCLHALINLKYDKFLDYWLVGIFSLFFIVITIKFINDVYNLLSNHKKMKGFKELL